MGTTRKLDWNKLSGAVALTRVRLAAAQGKFESAKAALRLARRRQKEAKLIVRRAKKARRQAKAELLEIRSLYAEAEAKIAKYKADKEKLEKESRLKQKPAKADLKSATTKLATMRKGGSRHRKAGVTLPNTAPRVRQNKRATAAGSTKINHRKNVPGPGTDGSSSLANSRKRE